MLPEVVNILRCSRCGEHKPQDHFSRNAREKTGRNCWCKACFAAYRARNADRIRETKKAEYAADREGSRAKSAAYYQANRVSIIARVTRYETERKEQRRRYNREYRDANVATLRVKRREWAKANAKIVAARLRAWHIANPGKVRESSQRRRALKKSAPIGVLVWIAVSRNRLTAVR